MTDVIKSTSGEGITTWIEYCPKHIGVGFPGNHIGYRDSERLFQCTFCGHRFTQSEGIEVDPR